MRSGKKSAANRIIWRCLDIIEEKRQPIPRKSLFEKRSKIQPLYLKRKARRVGGATYRAHGSGRPIGGIALSTLMAHSVPCARAGKSHTVNLSNEPMDAVKSNRSAIRKREETYWIYWKE
jgi:ribosomal protein S7